jgi:hypothetical protein
MAIKKKEFNLDDFKKKHSTQTKYKDEKYLHCGDAFHRASGIAGPGMGHINMFLGHTDTGKTTAMLKAAASAQKEGILPIFIITEKKWSFPHAQLAGLDCTYNPESEQWEGFFIYTDNYDYIEQVFDFINNMLDLQKSGELPHDLAFFWDSIGSIPCKLTFDGKGGKQHTAGVLAEKIGLGLNQRISSSRKEESQYTNALIIVNQPWVELPDTPFGQPRIKAKGGEAAWLNSTLVFLFGNQRNSGISKLSATSKGRKIAYATRTKVSVLKNHINGLGYSDGKVIATPHGFIMDDKDSIENYKKEYKDYWTGIMGGDYTIEDEDSSVDLRLPTELDEYDET